MSKVHVCLTKEMTLSSILLGTLKVLSLNLYFRIKEMCGMYLQRNVWDVFTVTPPVRLQLTNLIKITFEPMLDKMTSQDMVCAIMGDFNIDQKVNVTMMQIPFSIISLPVFLHHSYFSRLVELH